MSEVYIQNIQDQSVKKLITPAELGITPIPKSNYKMNALLLAYLYLVDAATTQTHTAMIKAMQLENSNAAQAQISNEMDNIRWFDIPKGEYSPIETHSVNPLDSWETFVVWCCGGKLEQYTTGGELSNRADIDIAIIENQVSNNQQQLLQQKLAMIQQQSEIKDTEINTDCNTDMSTVQQCSGILDLVKATLDRVLLTHKSKLEEDNS